MYGLPRTYGLDLASGVTERMAPELLLNVLFFAAGIVVGGIVGWLRGASEGIYMADRAHWEFFEAKFDECCALLSEQRLPGVQEVRK